MPYKSRYRFDYYKQQIQHNSHYINRSHVLGINMVVVVMMVMVVAFTVMGMFLARMLPAFNIVLIMKMMHNYYFFKLSLQKYHIPPNPTIPNSNDFSYPRPCILIAASP